MPFLSSDTPLEAAIQQVRLLINDPTGTDNDTTGCVFGDDDLAGFLALEAGIVKRAAAQALDVIADDEVLTSKVIRTAAGTSTDGAKVADSLRKRATALREQADIEDPGFFEIVDVVGRSASTPIPIDPLHVWPW